MTISQNPGEIAKIYQPGTRPDQFLSDIKSFRGTVYAVKAGNTVVIKQIFSSFKSFFTFLASVLFDANNTFLNNKKINIIINDLNNSKVSNVATSALGGTVLPENLRTAEVQNNFKKEYHNFTDVSFPYLDGWLSNLKELSNGDLDANMLQYIKLELDAVEEMIARKENEVKPFENFKDNLKVEAGLEWVARGFATLKKEVDTIKRELDGLDEKTSPSLITVPGIKNAGNSCYMNSALQGILASPFVIQRIKDYNKDPIPKDESYMPQLKNFLNAYEKYNKGASSENSKEIGACASKLRSELYQARLENLGVEELADMADADLVVMVLGEVLKLEYQLVTRRTAEGGTTTRGHYITSPIVSDVSSRQLLWPEIKTSGRGDEPTLQNMFDQQCRLALEEDNLGWETKASNGRAITVNKANTAYRLAGTAPPLLVFKVGNSTGSGMDATFTPYAVGQRDEVFDATKAFDVPPEEAVKYRLISILENHERVHWTAKTRREDGWYNCSDNIVDFIGTDIPEASAAVMIYERIS